MKPRGHLRAVWSFAPGWLLAVALAAGCGPTPPGGIYYAAGERAVNRDGLHRIQWEAFHSSFVKPGTDFQRYTAVFLAEPTVSYKSPPRAAPTSLTNRRPVDANYALSERSLAALKRLFREEFEKTLARHSSFTIADGPGPDVLLVAGHIVDLVITVPPERYQSSDDRYYSSYPGRMTLFLEVKDSQSGEDLLQVGQRRHIQMPDAGYYEVDPVSGTESLRWIFHQWADALRRELDQFRTLAELPPAPAPNP